MSVYAYCYIMQKRWWFCNTNHVTQASQNLAPDKILSAACPPTALVLQRNGSSKRKDWQTHNREFDVILTVHRR